MNDDVKWLATTLSRESGPWDSKSQTGKLELSLSRRSYAVAVQGCILLLDSKRKSLHKIRVSEDSSASGAAVTVTALCWVPYEEGGSGEQMVVDLLMVGTSAGFIHLYTSTGQQILRQRVHNTAIVNISPRAQHQGLDIDDTSEELAIGYKGGVARVLMLEIKAGYMRFKTQSGQIPDLHLTKWSFPKNTGERHASLLLGNSPASLYQRMVDRSRSPKVAVLTVGRNPTIGLMEGPEFGGEGILAAVSDLAAGLKGVAKTLTYGRPNGYRAGLTGWIGKPKAASGASTPSADEPPPSHAATCLSSFQDDPRAITQIATCPRGPLVAVADNLGRVMVVDSSTCMVLTQWKAYRRAQLAWLRSTSEEERGIFWLVIYAPNRLAIEIWHPILQVRQRSWPCSAQGFLLVPPCVTQNIPAPLFLDLENYCLEDLNEKCISSIDVKT